MELHILAQHHALSLRLQFISLIQEQAMQRRDACVPGILQRVFQQQSACFVRCGQQPPAGHRRKRYGAYQLGVIAQPVPLISLGPCKIEHVLAIRIHLQV